LRNSVKSCASLKEHKAQIITSLARLDSERGSLPEDDDVRQCRAQAQDAADSTSRAASELREALAQAVLSLPQATWLDETTVPAQPSSPHRSAS
jgi:hypothetical protein